MFHPVWPCFLSEIGPKYQKPRCGKQKLSSKGIGGFYVSAFRRFLVGQSFSALSASSLQYVSAVSGSHSLSEAVLFLSLTLFRLIGSEHCVAPPYICWYSGLRHPESLRKRVAFQPKIRFIQWHLILNHKSVHLSRVFLIFFIFLSFYWYFCSANCSYSCKFWFI